MKSRKQSQETKENQNVKTNKPSKWKKIVTTASIALAGFFTSCDKVPNDQIILNSDEQSVALSFEYQFSEGSAGAKIIDYNVFVRKNGDKFEGIIEESDGFISKKTSIESDNIDGLFDAISNKSDSEFITENTRSKKNAKLGFAKQVYEDSVLNNKNPSKGETRIKYKRK